MNRLRERSTDAINVTRTHVRAVTCRHGAPALERNQSDAGALRMFYLEHLHCRPPESTESREIDPLQIEAISSLGRTALSLAQVSVYHIEPVASQRQRMAFRYVNDRIAEDN